MKIKISFKSLLSLALLLVLAWFTPILSAADAENVEDIEDYALEDLLNLQVVSVSKKVNSFHDSATSIYVLTRDDIRRSGATRLTELLNMVPGSWFRELTWGFTANGVRSPMSEFPQSVLVLLDGVPMQTSITGGPVYSYLEVPVQQIERIEVIKGPGGTIYGSNANTGIINIFTVGTSKESGLTVHLGGGFQDFLSSFIRYNKPVSKKASLSMFFNYSTTRGYDKTDAFKGDILTVNGQQIVNKFPSDSTDNRRSFSGGLAFETELSKKVKSTSRLFYSNVNSSVYTSSLAQPEPWELDDGGSDFIISQRLDITFSKTHGMFMSGFFRRQSVDFSMFDTYNPRFSSIDLEIQDNFHLGNHELSIGGNLRSVKFDIRNNPANDAFYLNSNSRETLYGFFVQDKISLGKTVDVTLGIKGETWTLISDTPTFSPSARIMIHPGENWRFWAALSRSVTTPGMMHVNMERRIHDISQEYGMSPGSLYISLVPGEDVKPTEYITFEAGFRKLFGSLLYLDVSGFYARYDDVIGLDENFMVKAPVPSLVGDYINLPIYFTNIYKGKMYGGEAIARIQAKKHLKLEISYSLFKIFDREGLPIPGTNGAHYFFEQLEAPRTPEHIIRFRPYIDFPGKGLYLTMNFTWASRSYTGFKYNYLLQELDRDGVFTEEPGPQLKLDVNIEKRFANGKFSLNIWGRNLLRGEYVDYNGVHLPVIYPHTIHPIFGAGINYRY